MSHAEATSPAAGNSLLAASLSPEVVAACDTYGVIGELYSGMRGLVDAHKTLGSGWRHNEYAPVDSIEWVRGDRRGGNSQTVLALTQAQTSTGSAYYMEQRDVRAGRFDGATDTERNEYGYTVTHTTYEFTNDAVLFSSITYTDQQSGGAVHPLHRGRSPEEMVPLAIGGIQDVHNNVEQLLRGVKAVVIKQRSGWLTGLLHR